MRIIYVSTEIYPALKTGGLADVNAALPKALLEAEADIRLLLPAYPAILESTAELRQVARLTAPFCDHDVRLLRGVIGGVPAYLIQTDTLYTRLGNPYVDDQGQDWPDNHLQFALLGWVAACFSEGNLDGWRPDIVHCHDWHTGLTPAYLVARGSDRPGSVFTIHNLAYQGEFPESIFADLALPSSYYSMDGLEYYGKVNYMKSGLYYSDHITTVSNNYAREIQTPEFGCGMDGVLRYRASALTGILNGVDKTIWNPRTDPDIARHYSANHIAGKAQCKYALREAFGLAHADGPLFCVISRLSSQKGLDLVIDVLPDLVQRGGQFMLLGTGDEDLQSSLRLAATRYPGAVNIQIAYDESLAHRIIAGADVIMVPSRFEPCGLTQMYGLAYGTLPLVRRVGGLADTVRDTSPENLAADTASGFVFDGANAGELRDAVVRVFSLWAKPALWEKVRHTAMVQDFGWQASALKYMDLYRQLRPMA